MIKKAGFGGGCHWCTEAVFLSLKGVISVVQGWIASDGENTLFSEGIIIEYDSGSIPLKVLIAVHLHTHSSTAVHSMRDKYRSAVYTFNEEDHIASKAIIKLLQADFDKPLITQVLPCIEFKINREELLNYYYNGPEKPFCEHYIDPKLRLLIQQFSRVADLDKLKHL